MKLQRWQVLLALSLLVSSLLIYILDYIVFGDIHHILVFLVEDIAFLPIEVLLVTLILHRLLSSMEKRSRLEKLNMVIGVFFSEMGTDLLAYFSKLDPELESIRSDMVVTTRWSDEEFSRVISRQKGSRYSVEVKEEDLEYLRDALSKERDFLLALIENPTLLEHESFTDLLLSIFHLSEELARRPSLKGLPRSDLTHLKVDTERIYKLLVHEWLEYMRYLKVNYPYLFHLAMRTNPFDKAASTVIQDKPNETL
jgi:hypothetical protein